jgi:hypothetical protein
MTLLLSKAKRKRVLPRLLPACLAVSALVLLIGPQHPVQARGSASERAVQANETRNAGDPILAIVSLQKQHINIYDSEGWILRAPVSSGQKGRETPAGVFSVIQKEAEHYSNLYDDAFMPHMQRLTWSGIALHGGVLPGHAASHGCVRMPYEFAEQLFDLTHVGLRVIVAPTDPAPVEIAHPALLQAKPGAAAQLLARNAELAEATLKLTQARQAAGTAYREATAALAPVRIAENQKIKADAQLAAADTAATNATSDEAKQAAEDAKAKATALIADLQTQIGYREGRTAGEGRCPLFRPRCGQRRRGQAGPGRRSGAPGCTGARAGLRPDQPQDAAALRPAGIRAGVRRSHHDRRSRPSDRDLCLHRR